MKSLSVSKLCVPLHSQTRKQGAIAQLVEQRTENPCVPGSIPGGTTERVTFRSDSLFYCQFHEHLAIVQMVEQRTGRAY